LKTERAEEYGRFMQFLAAAVVLLVIGCAFGLGIVLATKGYSGIPLLVIFLLWAVAFAKLGCIPPKDSH
jgi:hypothetical protein